MSKLKYTWQDNAATQDDPNDYYPKITDLQYKTEDDLIKDITGPGSILKETELRAVKRRMFQQIASYIEEGFAYKDDGLTAKPGLGGKARDADEPWDDERHSKYVNLLPGELLKEAAANMQLEQVADVKEAAIIETVEDFKSETINDKLTPGHMMRITGSQLKIHSQGQQGLFLVNRGNGQEYPASPIDNFPSQLLVTIPDNLPAGEYFLKIVNAKHYNSPRLRTALSEIILTVQ